MLKQRQPKIGLALGAGGARGWSHIGVIEVLTEAGIRPDIVCGTSMGALVGAAYAAGEHDRLKEWALSLGWREVFGLMDFTWRGGLIRGKKLFEFMRSRFGLQDIAALPMPYGAVATELDSGREVWLREGHVLDAVRASIAIPGVFAPVLRDGALLVDGGLVNPVPVSMCRALGADVVIAVDLGWSKLGIYRERGQPGPRDDGRPAWWQRFLPTRAGSTADEGSNMPSPLGVFFTSFDIMQVRVARSRLAGDPADALITPMLPDFVMMDFDRAREAIDEGRAAAERARPVLEHLLRVK
ncbi:MAG TPA: patatin-like phospholipase RssA [Burkholderiales bacterium]|nr:patatin-like phospholipase RssA [Burkholderiales bacterium]